ncbi:MAG TPA: hypothetical protein VIM73_15825, partial [Polyangiaceae bacterium]
MRARALSTVLAAWMFVACAEPQPPTLTPKAVQLVEVGPPGLTLRLELDVNNPNAFPLVVNSVEGTLE